MSSKENHFTWQKALSLGGILCLILLLFCVSGCQSDGDGKPKMGNPFASKEKKLTETEKKIAQLNQDAEKAARSGKLNEAKKSYEEILAIYDQKETKKSKNEKEEFKREVGPYCQLGIIAENFGQFEKAEDYYRQAMEVDPKDPKPVNCLGYCFLSQRRLDDAILYLNKAVEMDPSEPKFSNNLGLAYGLKKDYDHAFQCFRRVASEADAYYNMSALFAMNEQEKEAKMALERAVEIDPNHREAKRMLTAYSEYEQNPDEYSKPLLSGSFPGASIPYQEATAGGSAGQIPASYERQFGAIHQTAMGSAGMTGSAGTTASAGTSGSAGAASMAGTSGSVGAGVGPVSPAGMN